MKYLIKESKLNSTIENFILDSYPIVNKVLFSSRTKILGSIKGTPSVEFTIITIILDNSEVKYKTHEMRKIFTQIRNTVNSFFNLEMDEYGSLWEMEGKQLTITSL